MFIEQGKIVLLFIGINEMLKPTKIATRAYLRKGCIYPKIVGYENYSVDKKSVLQAESLMNVINSNFKGGLGMNALSIFKIKIPE